MKIKPKTVVDIQPKNVNQEKSSFAEIMTKEIELFPKLNDKKKERFFKELSTLLDAGIDIKAGLELIIEGQDKKIKPFFEDILNYVINGGSFSQALEQAKEFTAYETFSIKIGEETGQLPKVLVELSSYYTRRLKNKRQLISAISYPSFIMLVAIGALVFMLNFVVPLFKELFVQFGQELPAITKFILAVSEQFGDWMIPFVVLLIGTGVSIYVFRKNDTYRKITSTVFLRIPVIGELFAKIYLARFTQAMAMLIGANTPLVQALSLTEKMIGFYPIEDSLKYIREQIMKGDSLAIAMKNYSIYPNQMTTLINVGEDVNRLDKMFSDLSDQYNEEIEYQTKVLTGLMEPLLIVFVGCIIAVVLLAMYLPMFNMSSILG